MACVKEVGCEGCDDGGGTGKRSCESVKGQGDAVTA